MGVGEQPPEPPVLVLLAHANGFNREVWRGVEAEVAAVAAEQGLAGRVQTFPIDLPGHGLTGDPIPEGELPSWDAVGACIRREVEALREAARQELAAQMVLSGRLGAEDTLEPVVLGVGHSLGGAGCVTAEVQARGTFDRLLLWEPILFTPLNTRKAAGGGDKAKMSAKRRADFPSPEAALESFASKPLFADWDRRSLEGYIDGGLRPKAEASEGRGEGGDGWTLSCTPEAEAGYFATSISPDVWATLNAGAEPACPTHVLFGTETNIVTLSVEYYKSDVFGNNAAVSGEAVEGASHLGPLEDPRGFARRVVEEARACLSAQRDGQAGGVAAKL